MIDLELFENLKLRFRCDSSVLKQLDSRYQRVAELLRTLRNSSKEIVFPTDDLLLLALHPLAQGLLAFQKGYISPERAARIAGELCRLDRSSMNALAEGKQRILQLQCLLPDIDTRGETIQISDNFSFSQSRFDDSLETLIDCCGEDYRRFLGIVKTVTVVTVPRMGELPYFSGADTDSWGAMHTTAPADDFVLAETLTHEAAHHWLFTLEEITPMAENPWSGNAWISPWRSDLRPIGGVVHGVFVFSCAAVVLISLVTFRSIGLDDTTRMNVTRRVCRLCAQVEAGLNEMQRCREITPAGRSLAASVAERIGTVESLLDTELLRKARDRCEKEQKLKHEKYFPDSTKS
jgi:hypothetical protein